nr:hypothetical protein 13 [bacterium]
MRNSNNSLNIFSTYIDAFCEACKVFPTLLIKAGIFYLPYIIIKLSLLSAGITLLPFDLEKIFIGMVFYFFVLFLATDYLADRDNTSLKTIFKGDFVKKFFKAKFSSLFFGIMGLIFIMLVFALTALVPVGFLALADYVKGFAPFMHYVLFVPALLMFIPYFICLVLVIDAFFMLLLMVDISVVCNDLKFFDIFRYNFKLVKTAWIRLALVVILNGTVITIISNVFYFVNGIQNPLVVQTEPLKWLGLFVPELLFGVLITSFSAFFYIRLFLGLEEINGIDSPLFATQKVAAKDDTVVIKDF